jgi:hypothetical protein
MKKILIFSIIAICIWLGWNLISQEKEVDITIAYDDNYLPEDRISTGNRVDLKKNLIPGRYTVFLFYADW